MLALIQDAGSSFCGSIFQTVNIKNTIAAIALQTGRAKDKARLLQFIEAAALDAPRFQTIVVGHGLADPWRRFEQQFLGGNA